MQHCSNYIANALGLLGLALSYRYDNLRWEDVIWERTMIYSRFVTIGNISWNQLLSARHIHPRNNGGTTCTPLRKSNRTIFFRIKFELDPKISMDCVWYVLKDPLAKPIGKAKQCWISKQCYQQELSGDLLKISRCQFSDVKLSRQGMEAVELFDYKMHNFT